MRQFGAGRWPGNLCGNCAGLNPYRPFDVEPEPLIAYMPKDGTYARPADVRVLLRKSQKRMVTRERFCRGALRAPVGFWLCGRAEPSPTAADIKTGGLRYPPFNTNTVILPFAQDDGHRGIKPRLQKAFHSFNHSIAQFFQSPNRNSDSRKLL